MITQEEKDYMLLIIVHDEAIGLSELELPQITESHNNEGIVWTKIKGESEPKELCNLSDSDLKDIVNWFKEEMNIV